MKLLKILGIIGMILGAIGLILSISDIWNPFDGAGYWGEYNTYGTIGGAAVLSGGLLFFFLPAKKEALQPEPYPQWPATEGAPSPFPDQVDPEYMDGSPETASDTSVPSPEMEGVAEFPEHPPKGAPEPVSSDADDELIQQATDVVVKAQETMSLAKDLGIESEEADNIFLQTGPAFKAGAYQAVIDFSNQIHDILDAPIYDATAEKLKDCRGAILEAKEKDIDTSHAEEMFSQARPFIEAKDYKSALETAQQIIDSLSGNEGQVEQPVDDFSSEPPPGEEASMEVDTEAETTGSEEEVSEGESEASESDSQEEVRAKPKQEDDFIDGLFGA